MNALPTHPSLYQINTRVTLQELSNTLGRATTLDDFPDAELDRIADLGFDWVWFLGVWQTGAAGRAVSRTQEGWRREFENLLPDLTNDDICGSPFAIQKYEVSIDFGGPAALKRLRQRMQKRNLRLLLDFVPNHVGLDHPWIETHPEFLIAGTEQDLVNQPDNYTRLETHHGPRVFAYGRDPYFSGWPDTLQLNYRHPGLRAAMLAELKQIAAQCDGIRCDMAMLVLPDIFLRTWGEASLPADGAEPVDASFWSEAIPAVHRQSPEFLFMAEVYWDLEWTLQQQGFNYTYDKRLCDRLHSQNITEVHWHLCAEPDYQQKSARFLENHDEARAADAFPWDVHQAAALITYCVPGLRFFHEGQFDGRKIRVPMHLNRRPVELPDAEVEQFYMRLMAALKRPELRNGQWKLLHAQPAWEGNPTDRQFLAFLWEEAESHLLIIVNYGREQGQCYVELPIPTLNGRSWLLQDLMHSIQYERTGDELTTRGLFLDMPAWGYHLFAISPQ